MKIAEQISTQLKVHKDHVKNVIELLAQGATIPFIARYRKEKTGSMDEVAVSIVRDRLAQFNALEERRTAILKSLEERELLIPDLFKKINQASVLTALEDLYEKYRPKKRTRAMAAREMGLEKLALFLLSQTGQDPWKTAQQHIDPQKGVETVEQAMQGARDIIAEIINDDPAVRKDIRHYFEQSAVIRSRVKKAKMEQGIKYKDYYEWEEPAFKAPSHRILAMLRAKKESVLSVHVLPDENGALARIEKRYVKNSSDSAGQVTVAIKDGYKRLLSKSIETECLKMLKEKADKQAIAVFVKNTQALLLSAPLGQKSVLAIDPGFRTGCKVVCLDRQGKLLHHDVIYPHDNRKEAAERTIKTLVDQFGIEAVAVGNGTAGRQTHQFVTGLGLPGSVPVVMVDESGASIYSASKTAREEFPDHDITVRGAVSIGRRLMDPLSELVKLDPRSIGVGQYQHDVDQQLLAASLDDTVEFCVNQVGVEVNTASSQLLSRVAGLNNTIAKNMVAYREQNGPYKGRSAVLKVPRLGPKAYEQAAGFLRVRGAKNPLDNSGIHPESYPIVKQMAADAGLTVKELMVNENAVNRINLDAYVTVEVGMPTLKDIKRELLNPGRDPRQTFENVRFDETVHEIQDLVPGMVLQGIVTNVTAFGAFVDIGVHQDGLVHISQLADRFVKDPNEIVTVRQQVKVRVMDVDIKRKRISLSMKKTASDT